ncbi:MAG: T9SS type A sorting domain-containing protein, partial [Saprospiraceae bacterium]
SIYTCSTTSPFAYNPFTAAGPGAIYKVSGTTGLIIGAITNTGPFTPGGTKIPNNGSALGDIGYDATHNQLFVTNHADGMIYRIKNGLVMSRFDPFGSINPPASGPGGNPDFVVRGERTWGVAYYNNRVYFATWTEDIGRPNPLAANEIWSIGLNGVGEFAATNGTLATAWENGEVLEIAIPTLPASTFSNPVSDIAFAADGKMLLAERTMATDCGGAFTQSWYSYAHSSRLLEYFFNTGTGQWELTPGHGNITASNLNLKFRTGDTNSGSNSAGGCDYGYASFDPAVISQPDCDQFVWNTGDNLHPYTSFNTYCSQNGVTWVYGMQGIPSAGGTNLNSLLIDFDNNVCTHDKILLGDVEILKCGCLQSPEISCDSLTVHKDSVAGSCCFDLSFGVHESPIQYIEIENLTSGVVFNNASINGSSGLLLGGGPTGTLLTIGTTPHQSIPAGDYTQLLHFCLSNITNASQVPQCIVIRWYSGPTPVDGAFLACTDTLCFYCQPPVIGDTCVYIKNDSIACNPENPLEYCYYFQVQNAGDFNASQVVLNSLPPGYAFKPCPPPNINITSPTIALPNPPLNPGIEPDSCSPQLCVKIVAVTPVLSPTLICFDVGLSSNDSCCHSTVEHCILLEPCCDPCEDKGVVVHSIPPVDSCCHSLDIINSCKYKFFTKVEIALITPGVIFGSHFTGGPFPGDWINPVSTNTLIQWQHISGSIPNGTTAGLINFCLDGIDLPNETPQVVVLNWLTTNSHGKDSIACSDTLIFDCPVVDNKCVEVLEQNIECIEDETGNFYYQLTMTIQNNSTPPHTANEVILNQIGGPPVTVFPNPILITPLPFGGTTTISTFIFGTGLNIGDKLTFEVRLHDSFSGDNWCCFEGDSLCVYIPHCGDSCCVDFAAFCTAVMNATNLTIDNSLCTATLNIGNLPDCGDYIASVNWGDGNQNYGPFNSGSMISHNYSVSGTFIITYLAIELDTSGLICFEKVLHDTITLDCSELCPNNLVVNPSFENYISCPTGLSPPFTASSWILPTDGSADYYNSCATSVSGVSVPNNSFGSQTPRTGSAYAGFILQPTNLYREYLEVQLSSPLISGNSYQVSFYVSLADQARWAIDKFGAYLSNTMVGPITGAPVLSLTPQVSNPLGNFITNKTGWTLVSGTYVASGGENFLVIGNFYDNISTTPVIGLGGFYQGSYYYIDDVSVCGNCVTPPCDSCCTDSLVFDGLVNQGFTVVNNGCSIIVTAPQFDSCYWFGTPPYVVGGFPVSQVVTDPGGSWTFTFSNSGTYQICVTVFDACQARQMCTDVNINCEGCHCGTFSDMAIRFERGPGVPLTCGGNPVFLSCPPSGYNYTFTGKFECQGNGCPDDAPVDWQLVGPGGGTVASGSEIGNPYISMSFPNSYFQQAGVYSLVLMGHCGSQSCPCVIKFLFDPPCIDVCPCTLEDVQAFITAVNKGFTQVLSSKSCKACFSPIALGDCETVKWYLNNTNGTPIGSSAGNNTFCYVFPGSGTYTIIMVVTRKKADGTNCETITKSQSVTVTCINQPDCVNSVLDNPTFSEGAVKGGLNTGGHSNGWKASSGNPKLLESQIGSIDGWTMLLSGNIDTADILSTVEPVCLAKIEGMIRIRIAVNDSAPGGVPRPFRGKPTKEQFDIELYQGNQISLNSCDGTSCYELASVSLRGLPHNEWLDLQIPYDLRDWDALDTCGGFPGVLVRPAMYVTNPFSNVQGGKETFTYVQLDNFCLGGTIVATEEPLQNKGISIFPNPTTGEIILQITGALSDGGAIQIIDLYGRLLFSENLLGAKERYSFTIESLPPGIYFVKILDNGLPVRIEKIIKE